MIYENLYFLFFQSDSILLFLLCGFQLAGWAMGLLLYKSHVAYYTFDILVCREMFIQSLDQTLSKEIRKIH